MTEHTSDLEYWNCQNCGIECNRRKVRGQKPRWCGKRCHRAAEVRRLATRECAWCLEPFEPKDFRSTSCSPVHGNYLARYGKPSSCRDVQIWLAPQPVPRTFYAARCRWCGESFISVHHESRYCSDPCAARAKWHRRAKARGKFSVSPTRRRSLHERDGWTCHICGGPTTRHYSTTDPLSPTLDHVIPQSWTLIPDHSDRNLRTAHAICNSARSNNPLASQGA